MLSSINFKTIIVHSLFINCGHFEFIIYKQKYFLKLNFFQKILLKYSSKLDGWSNDSEIYVLNYSLGSKGYELKAKDLFELLKQNELENFDPLEEAFNLLDPAKTGVLDIQRLK